MNNSDEINVFSQLRWESLHHSRVVIWDKCHQPDLNTLRLMASTPAVDYSNSIRHSERMKEWLATRVLSIHLTGEEPRESTIGVPTWSDGWLGSISHKSGHVALWVGLKGDLTCGVDLENHREFESELALQIMNRDEIWLSSAMVGACSSALVFAAKEAVYKALCPMVGRKFYFEAVFLSEVSGGQGDYLLKFVVAEPLSPAVPLGAEVSVAAKSVNLSDGPYWLALAFFHNFRQTKSLK